VLTKRKKIEQLE